MEIVAEKPANQYTLKDPPDLRSKFLLELERREEAKLAKEQQILYERELEQIKVSYNKMLCYFKNYILDGFKLFAEFRKG